MMNLRIQVGFFVAILIVIVGVFLPQNVIQRLICNNLVSLAFTHRASGQSTWARAYSVSLETSASYQEQFGKFCDTNNSVFPNPQTPRTIFRTRLLKNDAAGATGAASALIADSASRETDRAGAFAFALDTKNTEFALELVLHESNPYVLRSMARAAEEFGQPRLARHAWIQTASTNPLDVSVVGEAVTWLNQNGSAHDVVQITERILPNARNQSVLKLQLAHAYIGLGNDQSAEQLLNELQSSAPSATVYVLLGEIHTRQGELTLAEQDFQRALTYESKNLWAMFGLGRVMQMQGRIAEAKQWWRAALDVDPTFQAAKDALGIH